MRCAVLLACLLLASSCGAPSRSPATPGGLVVSYYEPPRGPGPHGPHTVKPTTVSSAQNARIVEALALKQAAMVAHGFGLDPRRRIAVWVFARSAVLGVPCGAPNGGGCYTSGRAPRIWLNAGPKDVLPHLCHELLHAYLERTPVGVDPTHSDPRWQIATALDDQIDGALKLAR